MGGSNEIPCEELQNDVEFQDAKIKLEERLQEDFGNEDSTPTITYLKCEAQIVSGVLYKITFRDEEGNEYHTKIYSQPWTQTVKVEELKRVISAD